MSTEQKPRFIRMDEGRIQRGNGSGGPSTSKPNIIPKPQRIPAMTKPLSAAAPEGEAPHHQQTSHDHHN